MRTRYAKVGEASVAYRLIGEGPIDVLLFMGEYMPVDVLDDDPRYAHCLRRLGSIGRVIVFNRRGVGLSDPPEGPLTQDQAVEDALAVMDDVGSARVVCFGSNVSGFATIQFAADHPGRVAALVLVNTTARFIEAPDYPVGIPEDAMRTTAEQTTATEPVDFDFLRVFAPSVAGDERFRSWWVQAGNRGASPARSRQLWELLTISDVRDALPRVDVPTLVIQRSGLLAADQGRYVAEHIRGARYVELPGKDLMWWVGDSDEVLDQIETFLAGAVGSAPTSRRSLATVLLVDVVSSTEHAAALGDRRWRDLLDTYHDIVRKQVERSGGQRMGTEGDGVIATFPMPADAIRCATALTEDIRSFGLEIRAGIHTGEIELLGGDVAGIGVHIAARVKEAADPGEVLVSRTVADLVTGSGLRFADRGEHDLKGVPGRWGLFAVEP